MTEQQLTDKIALLQTLLREKDEKLRYWTREQLQTQTQLSQTREALEKVTGECKLLQVQLESRKEQAPNPLAPPSSLAQLKSKFFQECTEPMWSDSQIRKMTKRPPEQVFEWFEKEIVSIMAEAERQRADLQSQVEGLRGRLWEVTAEFYGNDESSNNEEE